MATYPLVLLLSLYLLGYRYSASLGHWPAPYEVSLPASGSMYWHSLHTAVGFLILPFVSVSCVVWIVAARVRWPNYPMWRLLVLTTGCLLVCWLAIQWDPGGLLHWYFESHFYMM